VSRIPLEKISITPARPGEERIASDIATEAAEWLIGKGEPLWDADDVGPEAFRPRIETGELHLARVDGAAVGTMMLQFEDEVCWPDKPKGEALYVHRLAVRRSAAGRGVAQAMMTFAKRRTIEEGRRYLRLDAATERPKLRAVYESFGFIFHSDFQVGRFTIARYQIEVC